MLCCKQLAWTVDTRLATAMSLWRGLHVSTASAFDLSRLWVLRSDLNLRTAVQREGLCVSTVTDAAALQTTSGDARQRYQEGKPPFSHRPVGA